MMTNLLTLFARRERVESGGVRFSSNFTQVKKVTLMYNPRMAQKKPGLFVGFICSCEKHTT